METLSHVKKDLEFHKDLASLLEVLKTIAVSQYRSLEQKIKFYDKFNTTVSSFFEFIDAKEIYHPFLNPRNERQIIVAVTSDSGFLGGLNRQVVSMALNELERVPGKLIMIGERGKMYAREVHIPFSSFSGISDEQRYPQAMQLRDHVMDALLKESIGRLKVIYPKPISFTVQRVETLPLLPYVVTSQAQPPKRKIPLDIIQESNVSDILEYLIYLWLGYQFYMIFGLSRLAEFAARFVHLEESSQKLKERDAKLKLQYFRIRHELIDRNMRELFSARLLFTHKQSS